MARLDWLQKNIQQMGLGKVQTCHMVGGGSINDAWEVVTDQGHFFVKVNQPVDAMYFQNEIDGLEAIRKTNTICVPKVLGHHYDEDKRCAMLVLEWVSGMK